MGAVIASLTLPFDQVFERGFRGPLVKGALGAVLALAALIGLADWAVMTLAGGTGWVATAAGLLGGVAALFAAFWLFVPFVLAIAGLFSDETAAAVAGRNLGWDVDRQMREVMSYREYITRYTPRVLDVLA